MRIYISMLDDAVLAAYWNEEDAKNDPQATHYISLIIQGEMPCASS